MELFVRSFFRSDERSFVLFTFFYLYNVFLYFTWDRIFIIRYIPTSFYLCNWTLKAIEPDDALPENSQNLQSYCPCILKACYRYSSETRQEEGLKLLPVSKLT